MMSDLPEEDAAEAVCTPRPILVVDDSRAQRRIVTKLLADWGFDSVEASNGDEALEICTSQDVELVISDWMMPGMDGLALCRAFRDLRGRAPGYIILLTAQSEISQIAEGLEAGADDFLSKPVHPVELHARIRAGMRMLATQRAVTHKNLLLTKALDELTQVYMAIDKDLAEARKLQTALVPDHLIKAEGAEISLFLQPSGQVGGDLVGAFKISPDRFGVFSIDVAGHGIASALLVARVAGHLTPNAVEQNIALDVGPDGAVMMAPPEVVCARLNALLMEDIGSDHYLTMILADCDFSTGRICLSQAGHPSPLLQRADGKIEFPQAFGMPIGLIDGANYEAFEIWLTPGDRLLLFTDGVTECAAPDGTLLDEVGLARLATDLAQHKQADFMEALTSELRAYQGCEEFQDDVSAALIEFSGKAINEKRVA